MALAEPATIPLFACRFEAAAQKWKKILIGIFALLNFLDVQAVRGRFTRSRAWQRQKTL
jgi:hypothetical protein